MATKLPHEYCYEAVRQVAAEKGIEDYEIEVSEATSKGENFVGEVFRVKIRDKKDYTMRFVVKIPSSRDIRSKIPIEVLYEREIFTYNEIFKAYQELQDNAKVSSENKFNYPVCFYTSNETGKEIIILEDLLAEGFAPIGRRNKVNLKYAVAAVGTIAKMHALSFVLEKKDNAKFQTIVQKIPDFTRKVKTFTSYAEKSLNLAIKMVDNEEENAKLVKIKKTYWEKMQQPPTDKFSCISHNDSWLCNMLFQSKGEKSADARLIDYQLVRYGPAAVDLLYFIFTSLDTDLRKENYKDLLDHYYKTLGSALKEHGLDVAKVFPQSEFFSQVYNVAVFGVVAGIILSKPLVIHEVVDVTEMTGEGELAAPRGESYRLYQARLSGIVKFVMSSGYM